MLIICSYFLKKEPTHSRLHVFKGNIRGNPAQLQWVLAWQKMQSYWEKIKQQQRRMMTSWAALKVQLIRFGFSKNIIISFYFKSILYEEKGSLMDA